MAISSLGDKEKLTLDKVFERRQFLLKNDLWQGTSADKLTAWKNQFVNATDLDIRISTILLDALVVRTRSSAISAIRSTLTSVLPEITQNNNIWNNNGVIPRDILRRPGINLNILRLEQLGKYGAGQSSDDLIRLLRAEFSVNEKYFQNPGNNNHPILIIDEISCSGTQARNALSSWTNQLPNREIWLFFLAIHTSGANLIEEEFPNIKLRYTELLGEEQSAIYHLIRTNVAKNEEDAIHVLTDYTNRNFKLEGRSPILGFSDMTLCYKPAFTTPNNMLGAYRMPTKKDNVRLFERGY